MAEQFAFDEAGGKRGAIDLDQRLVGPPACRMDRARDEFLATTALARDQHRVSVGATRRTFCRTLTRPELAPMISSKLWTVFDLFLQI